MGEVSVNANNKIIDREMLLEIFEAMHQDLEKYRQLFEEEKAKNEPLQREYQKWTRRYFEGSLRFVIDYRDNHNSTYDDYRTFVSIFKNQAHMIKALYVYYSISYEKPNEDNSFGKSLHSSITLHITENRLDLSSDMNSADTSMQDVYNLITQKISAAPLKYDHIIKAKELINFKIGLAMGLIPATVAVIATAFVPQVKEFYKDNFYAFPLLILVLSIALGILLGNLKTSSSYAKLIPKKYGGYDANRRSSYYTDDLNKFAETSDVLIGEKTTIMTDRKKIAADEKRFTKLIPIFLGVAAIATLVMYFVTR